MRSRLILTLEYDTSPDGSVSVEITPHAGRKHIAPPVWLEQYLETNPRAVSWLREHAMDCPVWAEEDA